MKKITSLILFWFFSQFSFPQENKILIFDPEGVSESFQYSLSILTEDSVSKTDIIDEAIFGYDAIFIFLHLNYVLSQDEGNMLIDFLNKKRTIFIYSKLLNQQIQNVAFWGYIGIEEYVYFPIEVHVNYVQGIDSVFTKGLTIDTSFISDHIPGVQGQIYPVLVGVDTVSINLHTAFAFEKDSFKVVVDIYNLISDLGFLSRVLQYFGLSDPLGIPLEFADVLDEYILKQNYPNPFNPTTKIKFSVPYVETRDRVSVQLKVYDVLGSEIATLVNEELPAGEYEVEFSVGQNSILSLSSGVYFYQLRAGKFIETKKMILIR